MVASNCGALKKHIVIINMTDRVARYKVKDFEAAIFIHLEKAKEKSNI